MRRLSTATFAARAASRLENGAKLAEALRRPQIADILATLDAARPLRAMILGPFQVLKSAVGQLHLARNMLVRPGPALWYNPTGDASREFADQKLNPLLDAQPALRALAYPGAARNTKLRRSLAGGTSLLILSASTEADRHAKTARDLYIDEVHQIDEPGAIAQIRNRRGDYPADYLELMMSTGLLAHTEAHLEWLTTDQRTWHCRCPACQKLFEPRFAHYADDAETLTGGLRYTRAFDDNGLPDERAIAATLHYECPRCHAHLPDTDSARLALSGTAAAPRGLYLSLNPSGHAHSVGWTFHGISARPWLPIVMRFEKAQLARRRGDLEPLAKTVREEFAGVWDPELYLKAASRRPSAPYRMGDDWPYEHRANDLGSRFATIDMQQDYFVLVIRMWAHRSASRLRFCATPKSVTEINDILRAHAVEKRHVFLDSRHNHIQARRIAAQQGWQCMQGDGRTEGTAPKSYLHPDGIRRIYDFEPKLLDAFIGTALEGEGHVVKEWLFSKQSALDRLALLRNETYAPDPTKPDALEPLHACPQDTPDWYWRWAFAHRRKSSTNKDGSLTHYWFAPGGNDHAEDCEAMGIVVASMAGLTGSESLEPEQKKDAP